MKTNFSVTVKTCATTANLGAAYDTAAIAVELWNSFHLVIEADMNGHHQEVNFKTIDLGSSKYASVDTLMGNPDGNMFVKSFNFSLEHIASALGVGVSGSFSASLHQEVNIPPLRGLGSSSSACIAGSRAAMAFVTHLHPSLKRRNLCNLSKQESLEFLATLARNSDSCPDNICACLTGGLTVVYEEEEKNVSTGFRMLRFSRRDVTDELRFVFVIPSGGINTLAARDVIRRTKYPLTDITYNLTRASCLATALTDRRYGTLKDLMSDKIHQSYRYGLHRDSNPASKPVLLEKIFEGLISAGAYGVSISGAGSSVVAIVGARNANRLATTAGELYEKYSKASGWGVEDVLILKPLNSGVQLEQQPIAK